MVHCCATSHGHGKWYLEVMDSHGKFLGEVREPSVCIMVKRFAMFIRWKLQHQRALKPHTVFNRMHCLTATSSSTCSTVLTCYRRLWWSRLVLETCMASAAEREQVAAWSHWCHLSVSPEISAKTTTNEKVSRDQVHQVVQHTSSLIDVFGRWKNSCTKSHNQWRNSLTGGPWTNYIKGPISHFEFTEELIIIKVLTKITIKHKTMMKWSEIKLYH